MALTVGDLVAFLSLDSKPFEAGMASSEAKFRGFGTSLTSIATATGVAIGAALVVGGLAVGAGLVIATKAAADFQSQMTLLVTGASETQANLALVS